MSTRDSVQGNLSRLLDLVLREDDRLLAVRRRFFGDDCTVSASRVQQLLADDVGIDRLESFGAKFARLQDTVVDKLIPVLLQAAGERAASAIDNLERMNRMGLISSADEWLEMRGLRNRLVHEYIDQPEELALALEHACRFTDRMHGDVAAMHQFASRRLGVGGAG